MRVLNEIRTDTANRPHAIKGPSIDIISGEAMIAIDHQNIIGTQFDRYSGEDAIFDGDTFRLIDWATVIRELKNFFGPINSAMAFADWNHNGIYQSDLVHSGVELVHAPDFPQKNVDLKMTAVTAAHVMSDPRIKRVILLTHDGDFAHLAEALRSSGRIVIGVGIRDMGISAKLFSVCDAVYKISPTLPARHNCSYLHA